MVVEDAAEARSKCPSSSAGIVVTAPTHPAMSSGANADVANPSAPVSDTNAAVLNVSGGSRERDAEVALLF